MLVVFNAIQSVISVVVMIVIGYILTSKGWFDENNSVLIPKLVTNISLPPLMVYT
jgi:predicted permease